MFQAQACLPGTSENDIIHLVETTVARFGKIDCLFNNAAGPTQEAPLTEPDAETTPWRHEQIRQSGPTAHAPKGHKKGFGLEVVGVTDRGTAERNLGFKGAKAVELYV